MTGELARLRLRPVTPDDALLLAHALVAGVETYHTFAPPAFAPPTVQEEAERIAPKLHRAWGRIAFDGPVVAGHVVFLPADDAPGVVRLGGLFVTESWWGSGLVTRLLAVAVAEMRAQGYDQARLRTPALHARARRFYEREGWRLREDVPPDAHFGLDLLEYRLPLRGDDVPLRADDGGG
jgi:RimJ/RimL family protein N-acetyltransferase